MFIWHLQPHLYNENHLMKNENIKNPAIRVFERQKNVGFNDIDELFIARVLLGLVKRSIDHNLIEVEFGLSDLFSGYSSYEAIRQVSNIEFENSARIMEDVGDFFEGFLGISFKQKVDRQLIIDYYEEKLERWLHFLKNGDSICITPMIEDYKEKSPGVFVVSLRYERLVEAIRTGIDKRLNLPAELLSKIAPNAPLPARIDFRKEIDLLNDFLEERQKVTGEIEFQFSSKEMPFRHAISTNGSVAIISPGTCGPFERLLLPLYLEATGLLDITHIGVYSSPTYPLEIDIRYDIRRPSHNNIYEIGSAGLTANERSSLNEIQLSLYERIHKEIRGKYFFTARPQLEKTFASISTWLIKKITYSLEEPTFLGKPALEWLNAHKDEKYIKMEDDFFLAISS